MAMPLSPIALYDGWLICALWEKHSLRHWFPTFFDPIFWSENSCVPDFSHFVVHLLPHALFSTSAVISSYPSAVVSSSLLMAMNHTA